MKSAIISIGTELLFGQTINTNAAFLSQELNAMGIDVLYHYTMGDNPGRLSRILNIALEDCDLLVCTGGLGPTEDDLTKETIAAHFGRRMVMNQEALQEIKDWFGRTGFEWTENNAKQAVMPEDCVLLHNSAGTAPGFALQNQGKTIICMPGVPREMKCMWEEEAKPFLLSMSDAVIYSKTLKILGIGESKVETMLLPLIDGQTDPTIATYAKEGMVEVRITSKRKVLEDAEKAVAAMTGEALEILGDSVISDDGREIWQVLADLIQERKFTVSCCEETTAGMFVSGLAPALTGTGLLKKGIVADEGCLDVEELAGTYGTDVCVTIAGGDSQCVITILVEGRRFETSFNAVRRTTALSRGIASLMTANYLRKAILGLDMNQN